MSAQVAVVLLATASCGSGAAPPCAALQPLAGRAALAYWLDVLSSASRLKPLSERLVVVASTATEAALRAWADAQGLAGRVVVVPEASCSAANGGGGSLAAVLKACRDAAPELFAAATHIVVANGARVLEPGTSIARMLQAAVIIGQDASAVAGVAPPLGTPAEAVGLMGGSCEVAELASPLEPCSRVVAVRAAQTARAARSGTAGSLPPPPEAGGDSYAWARGPRHPALAPLCVLGHGAVQKLQEAAGVEGPATVGELLTQLLDEGLAVRAWQLEASLDLSTPEAAKLADAFFSHYIQIHQRLSWELQQAASASSRVSLDAYEPAALAKCTLHELEERLEAFGIHQAAAFVGHGSGGGGEPYGGFREVFARWMDGYLSSLAATAANPFVKDYKQLPERFADASSFVHRARKEHACYTTSSAEHGARHPTSLDMPLVWAGIRGKFTEAIGSGPPLSTTFKTHIVRSRVHRALDQL